jgi:hypothetical protein
LIAHPLVLTVADAIPGLLRSAGGRTGIVTSIQRFGSALNLNIHLHMLMPDGAYSFTARFTRRPDSQVRLKTVVVTETGPETLPTGCHRRLFECDA